MRRIDGANCPYGMNDAGNGVVSRKPVLSGPATLGDVAIIRCKPRKNSNV